MNKIVGGILGIIIFCLVTYGSYWVVKTCSYKLFYEDMVQETIVEMVKPKCLG